MNNQSNSLLSKELAKRVSNREPVPPDVDYADVPIPDSMLEYLEKYLAAGETHYTPRPGIPELRSTIANKLHESGAPKRGADSVIVTHGEGEALFVTLLGLGFKDGTTVVVDGECRHRRLLDLLNASVVPLGAAMTGNAIAVYRELDSPAKFGTRGDTNKRPTIVALGTSLFADRWRQHDSCSLGAAVVTIGDFNALDGLDHFRMGFVAGPPDTVKRIQTWKQAFSICSAGPSQRAALFALEGEAAS